MTTRRARDEGARPDKKPTESPVDAAIRRMQRQIDEIDRLTEQYNKLRKEAHDDDETRPRRRHPAHEAT